MRQATSFLAVAVLVGLFTTNTFARDPQGRTSIDHRASVVTVGHPSLHHRPYSYHKPWHGKHGYPYGYRYSVPPFVLQGPLYGPPAVIYSVPSHSGHRHICGPGCGPHCPYAYPHSSFYYRGNGWGITFGF